MLVALSMANRALAFAAEGNNERAAFTVLVVVHDSTSVVARAENEQVVMVASVKETTRSDESVVFQRFLAIPPGQYTVSVTITDQGSTNTSSAQIAVTVPRFTSPSLSSPTTVYRAVPRPRRDTLPDLIVNARSTLVFGRDSLAPIYLEAYGLAAGAKIALTVVNVDGLPLRRDTVTLTRPEPIAAAEFDLPISSIGLGRRMVLATVVGSNDTTRTPLWVTVGEGMGIINFEEMLSYLRYFATSERLQALRDTPAGKKEAAWSAFWRETDPNPATAENEALRDYFERIQLANQQFREQGEAGWLTDRGKVFITIGDPDQVQGQNGRSQTTTNGRSQYWVYVKHNVRLEFVDQSGTGRWRLTAKSSADFDQVAQKERVH